MDALIRTGVDLDNTKDVLVSSLQLLLSEQKLTNLRVQLFDEAKCAGLVHPSDNIVRRQKRAVGPTLVTKYATDIAELCYAIKPAASVLYITQKWKTFCRHIHCISTASGLQQFKHISC